MLGSLRPPPSLPVTVGRVQGEVGPRHGVLRVSHTERGPARPSSPCRPAGFCCAFGRPVAHATSIFCTRFRRPLPVPRRWIGRYFPTYPRLLIGRHSPHCLCSLPTRAIRTCTQVRSSGIVRDTQRAVRAYQSAMRAMSLHRRDMTASDGTTIEPAAASPLRRVRAQPGQAAQTAMACVGGTAAPV